MRRIKLNTERFHLRSPDRNICMKVDIEGEISGDQLYAAIERLGIIHPLLRSSIDVEDNGKAYYVPGSVEIITPRWVDTDINPVNSKESSNKRNNIEYIDEDKNDWQSIFSKYDGRIFDMINGPLIRFIMIHSKGMATLIIIGHHLLGDGMAFVYLIKDLMSIMGYTDLDISEKMPPLIKKESHMPKNTRLSLPSKLLVNYINKKWAEEKRVFSDSEYHNMFENYREEYKPSLRMLHIDSYSMLKFKNKCREHKVTVNDAVTAAFLYALQVNIPEHMNKKDNISVAVNVRNELTKKPEEVMGNFASAVSAKCAYDKDKDLWYNAINIKKKLNAKLKKPYNRMVLLQFLHKLDKSILDAVYFYEFTDYDSKLVANVAKILGVDRQNRGLGISNLMKLNIPVEYGKYKIKDIAFICPNEPANDITVGVVTFNGKMNIAVRYSKKNISENQIDKICKSAMKRLRKD